MAKKVAKLPTTEEMVKAVMNVGEKEFIPGIVRAVRRRWSLRTDQAEKLVADAVAQGLLIVNGYISDQPR
jgi:hypothetical protein